MKKGEIWIVDIGSTGGHEQQGIRPAVVIADVVGSVTTIIPCTSNLDSLRFPFTVQLEPSLKNGLSFASVVVIFQLRAIDKKKLKAKIGFLGKTEIKEIDVMMKKMLGI
ncbi:hypothetical protein A2641_00440 [Candidatus Nomurabacteria bacterium RIFCSPHIGHO2_01_FULL_37_25]|uniref:mRNA interferase n=1 Tax=Candidatus Nomurabacteria bacterium RIFCSPLOWO2_01_FULL_36_16 TaxID=1801767 RepID=A0A1F6WZA7_9BACT|nr:MAG: hypothetical protein A2641_00440 [Candidatus Nomurabacteria bacterium RIFCSPHIGHO2_01_FULL_37_25]OGI75877.1 MAG: hypothetical protein A3D36_01225 [Candidatus Nomurabacteria bacterium RIFCSPHIGHO2_02_FULL_36_29]OGI87236.1 MAG: hypothetical protein A3A91_03840 [Candidatus Nomurabacteria bacterium RIFCSPLOWO2_01_FULL_36_16]